MAYGIDEVAPSGWIAPGIRKFSLVGRIGNGAPFYVGTNLDMYASSAGVLYLGLNDCIGCHVDNTVDWWFTHQIVVYPSSTATFSAGDYALIVQTTGGSAGTYEIAKVSSMAGNVVSFATPLKNTYSTGGSAVAQIIRLPQYANLTVQNGGLIAGS